MKNIILILVIALWSLKSNAQIEKLSGPRFGVTFLSAGSAADFIHDGFDFDDTNQKFGSTGSAFITQYGWQWESRFADGGGNITGIVEWIALVGGMEQGRFLPSISSVVGVRTDNGFEVGVGPNLSLSGVGMVFGAGYNLKSGNLNIPINIVFMPGKQKKGTVINNGVSEEYSYNSGTRVSLMLGFNMSK